MTVPLYEPDVQATYTLDVVSKITGISSETILHYHEQGLIHQGDYDDEAVRKLRRIEHLRSTCGANLSGIKLILELLDQVERLQTELQTRL